MRPHPGDEPRRDRRRISRGATFDARPILAAAFREQGAGGVIGPATGRLTGFCCATPRRSSSSWSSLFFGLSAANFFGAENVANIVKQSSFIGIIAVGMTFVLLTAGIDLSVGSIMYVSADDRRLPPAAARAAGRSAWLPGSSSGSPPARRFGAINAFCIVCLRSRPSS